MSGGTDRMTQAPPRVRGTARIHDAPAAGPATLSPRRRPGHLGALHVLQLVLIEAVLVGLLAATNAGALTVTGLALIGLVVMLVVLSRSHGRWWLERVVMRRRYRRRRRAKPDPNEPDARLAALHCLAPALTVQTVSGPDGAQIGVAEDGAGWFAIAAVTSPSGMRGETSGQLPLDRLVDVFREAGQPGAVLQVVVHTVPAPSVDLDPRWPCEASYRELLSLAGPVPADRLSWVVVRLDAQSLAEAEVGGKDESAQAPAVVAALVRRLGKALRRSGLAYQILDADGVLEALARSSDLAAPVMSSVVVAPREDWRAWHSASLSHVSYWVRGWPDLARGRAMLDALAAAPASMTSVAMVLAAEGEEVDLQCVVRVGAPVDQIARACQGVVAAARSAGARLFRLDGEQAPAVYVTAPTGGGVR
ncbi:MAG: type VII secretion protein EccE [Micromonosporaceae bacterium]|nr:type VII secretion protein EccE [Micromonosporaceae bacterium]